MCEAAPGTSAKFSILTFGADIGGLEANKDVELRFSGGGFDHALKGQIHRAAGEEDLSGVQVDVEHDDPLWQAMAEKDSLDYLVPGYRAETLDLTRGRDKIKQFVEACRTYAQATLGGTADSPATPSGTEAGDANANKEKAAFESAKELGTIEAWEAFLASYASGFYADLARAYVKKLGSGESGEEPVTAPAKKPVANTPAPSKPPAKKATAKPGCGKGQIVVDGKCMSRQKAAGYCGPGYRPQGGKCVQGYVAPKGPRPSTPGCPPGLVWNAQEGCHEDD
jgi:hypothetical protein